MSTSSILLARTDLLHTVLFSGFHAPGKRTGGVRLVSIQMIMMRIFVRLVVHQQEFPLLLLSSLVWTCRRSIAVLWPLNLRQVASLIRSKSLPCSLKRQLSSFLASLSPPKSMSSASSKDIVKFLISKDKTGRTLVLTQTCDSKVCKCPRPRRFRGLPYREVACHL